MKLYTGENRKVTFFYLFLANFIVTAQLVAVPLFSRSLFDIEWATKIFVLSLGLSFLVFLFSFDLFGDFCESKKLIQSGLIFLALGSLVDFLFLTKNFDFFIFGRTIGGLGSGMIIAGQLGMMWHLDMNNFKKFSLLLVWSFFLGAFISPIFIKFLSGPRLSGLDTIFVLGTVVPMLAVFEMGAVSGKLLRWIAKEKRKLAIWGLGYAGNMVFVSAFDYVLYPFVIWKTGILKGSLIMTVMSFLICWVTLVLYDWARKDWLGIETIKMVKHYDGESLIGKITSWILKKSDPAVLLFLSIKFDPFITTAYMRHGSAKYNGLSRRDWTIFITSLVVGNVYWTLVAFTGVSIIEYANKVLF